MKRAIALGFVLMLGLGLAAFAAETTVHVNWDVWGGPGLTIDFFNGDDSNSSLYTGGSYAWGDFYGTDFDDNPYGYGVDSGSFSTKAYVENGGVITFDVNRTDSKASTYGPSGQRSYSEVWTFDGAASIETRTSTNYASQKNCNYGWQANNQYTAAGSDFHIEHFIEDGDGEGAGVRVWGNGSATVTSMSDEMGGSSFRLGRGCGCYDNANASGTGSGTFELYGHASNALSGNGWSSNGGSYFQQIIYTDGFNIDDIHINGN